MAAQAQGYLNPQNLYQRPLMINLCEKFALKAVELSKLIIN